MYGRNVETTRELGSSQMQNFKENSRQMGGTDRYPSSYDPHYPGNNISDMPIEQSDINLTFQNNNNFNKQSYNNNNFENNRDNNTPSVGNQNFG